MAIARNVRIGTILSISVLAFLLVAASSPCFASMSIEQVSTERAKELGMEIRTIQPGPRGARVELEFEVKRTLKSYYRVDFMISDGEKTVVFATLKEEESRRGRIIVSFYADRTNLDRITLRVVVGQPGNLAGYDLRVKDFVELERVR